MDHARSERVSTRGGTGRLRLLVHGSDAAVVLDALPVAMVWQRGSRSERWFVRAHDLGALEDELKLPDAATASLAEIARDLLALLPDGPYRLGLEPMSDVEADVPAADDTARSSGDVLGWLGLHQVASDDALLLGTLPRDLIDRAAVRACAAAIARGARPPVVLLEAPEQEVSFIVAGHTALEAYRRLGMAPVLLTVEPLKPDTLSEQQGADLLAAAFDRCGEVVAAQWRALRESEAVVTA